MATKDEVEMLSHAMESARVDGHTNKPYGEIVIGVDVHEPMHSLVCIQDIDRYEGKDVNIRCRLHDSRKQGKMVFLILREYRDTVQAVVSLDNVVNEEMVKFAKAIPKESIVELEGRVIKSEEKIESCTKHFHELSVKRLFLIGKPIVRLPINIDEVNRPELPEGSEDTQDLWYSKVNLDTRLNNRVLDLRGKTNHAIFVLSSFVCKFFRDFCHERGFVEIHTPKLLPTASESGSCVFEVGYFKRKAFLAQSPQLYKQMCMCSDFERVFEIAPVFRAENSFTHRHMTEFVGVDLEMCLQYDYHEVMRFLGELFVYIFEKLKEHCSKEISIIKEQYPFEDIVYPQKLLILTYKDAVKLLNENGVEMGPLDDMNTTQEKQLGKLVKKEYNTDFFALDKFPVSVRPFYTMPDASEKEYSNSYDYFLRGEEILSGAQRIHDYDMLCSRVKDHGIDKQSIEGYLDAFRYGVPPHGGAGIGLERLVMLFLNLGNIRKSSMFPRDPKRIKP